MAIKVKHEGSAASRIAASAAGGAAKRAMDAASLAKGTHIVQKQAAHSSAPGISPAHAQLIHSPGGGAHAQLIGGGGGIGATGRAFHRPSGASSRQGAGSGGSGSTSDFKVTGTDVFSRPDDASVWNPETRQWIRGWLPGEKEAEAAQRMNPVLEERYENRYSAKQRANWDNLENAYQEAVSSGRYTKDELAQLRKQTDLQKIQIKENPMELLEKPKSAQDDINSRLVTINGVQYYRNSKGDLELPPTEKADDGGFGDFMKIYPKLSEYTEEVEQTDPITGKKTMVPVTRQRTPDEVAEIYRQMKKAWDGGSNKGAASPGAGAEGVDPAVAARNAPYAPMTELTMNMMTWPLGVSQMLQQNSASETANAVAPAGVQKESTANETANPASEQAESVEGNADPMERFKKYMRK